MKSVLHMINQNFANLIPGKTTDRPGQSLFNIVTRFLYPYHTKAIAQNSQLINVIPGNVKLYMDKDKFLKMLDRLLSMVLLYGRETRLTIHADSDNNFLHLAIKSSNTYNGYAIHAQFDEFQSYVNKFGAVADINSMRNKETTVTLTIPNRSSKEYEDLLL